MRWSRLLTGLTVVIAAPLALVLLHACQDLPKPTEVESATATVARTLTVTGSGTGNGVVTSSPAKINCTVTGGTAAATGCTAQFANGVAVTLTATPKSGSSFRAWFGACAGTGACKLSMTASRTVQAQFLKGPFTVKISGGAGTGSGTVKTQAGLTPALSCVITKGVAAATGCSASYPANVSLTLTATPAAGNSFTGWGAPCSGSGTCQYTVIQARTITATFAPGGSNSAAVQGKWGVVFPTPVVAVHMHLLPTAKVLLWGDQGDAQLWDPADPSAGFTAISKTYRIFCSGHTFLPDGRLLVTGGVVSGTTGDARAVLFNPSTGSWSSAGPMAQGRYYPTTTALPSGEILAVSGNDENRHVVTIPEIWNGSTWRRLTTASLSIPGPFYPAMFVAPSGKVFLAGFPQTSQYLDVTGTGAWTTVGDRNVADRRLGSAVMYAPGKILYAGGGDPPTRSAEVIDLNPGSPAWRSVPGMQFARRQMNATLLADGQVLVTGGTSGPGFNDVTSPVFDAELWNPATESWKTMARESVVRTYHSTALLLPDARVLSSGSGEGGGVSFANSQLSAQIFSPPYLFNPDGTLALRPTITSAPSKLSYGQPLTVQTPDAGSVTRGTLIRLSSVTHAFNQSQLIYPLTFSVTGSTTLSADGPQNANLAPPGPYMLFLVNAKGVPSKAKMVTVGP